MTSGQLTIIEQAQRVLAMAHAEARGGRDARELIVVARRVLSTVRSRRRSGGLSIGGGMR